MSVSVRGLCNSDDISIEPVGVLKQQGWLPGTWVKFSSTKPVFSPTTLATATRCEVGDYPAGFLKIGSVYLAQSFDSKFPNDNDRGFWKPDENVQFAKSDTNATISFDTNHQLSGMGSGIVMMVINATGAHKFYVYEKYDRGYRDTNGVSGSILDYESNIGSLSLHVSSRGLLTCEKEELNSNEVGYCLASVQEDDNGKYLVIVSS